MNPTLRQAALLGLLALMLLGIAGWSYRHLDQQRRVAREASADLAEVQRFAQQIRAMRQRPAVAGSREMELNELTQRIERAAEEAQIAASSLVRIWPQPARRAGDSPYKEKPTQILLRHVTLEQLVGFLHHLSEGEGSNLTVQRLRIVAPRHNEHGDRWTVETTVTYLIYSPPSSEQQMAIK